MMPRQKSHRARMYQLVGEPGPGSIVVAYVCYLPLIIRQKLPHRISLFTAFSAKL